MKRNYDKTREYMKTIPGFERWMNSFSHEEAQRIIEEAKGEQMQLLLLAFQYGFAVGYKAGTKKG